MNRRELVKAVAHHTDRDRKDVDEVLRGFTDVVTTVVAKGEPVSISGFAKFQKVDRPARMGRNPQTGEPVKIKASKKPRITPLKGFKDSVIKPSQAPKLSRGTWPPSADSQTKARSGATKSTAKRSTNNSSRATTRTSATRKTAARKTAGRR